VRLDRQVIQERRELEISPGRRAAYRLGDRQVCRERLVRPLYGRWIVAIVILHERQRHSGERQPERGPRVVSFLSQHALVGRDRLGRRDAGLVAPAQLEKQRAELKLTSREQWPVGRFGTQT